MRKEKYQETLDTIATGTWLKQGQMTMAKKGRHFYKMHIAVCGKCKRKFRMNKHVNKWCERFNKTKCCPICKGMYGLAYLMVGKKERQKMARYYKSKICTVRKMTEEEKKKYNLN